MANVSSKIQAKFTRKLALLILYANELGYDVTFGDVWAFNLWPVIKLLNRAMAALEKSSHLGIATMVMGFLKPIKKFLMKHTHSPKSYHYFRLAADLNLFRDGEYLTHTEDHRPLGERWIELGGTWGGNFKRPDGNHYSWGEGKR